MCQPTRATAASVGAVAVSAEAISKEAVTTSAGIVCNCWGCYWYFQLSFLFWKIICLVHI